MAEIIVEVPTELDERVLAGIKREIGMIVRLRLARELLLKEWEKRFSKSELTEAECLELGKEVNKAVLKLWKEKGWL